MADHRHHGEGEHHHRHVAMPAMPGSALVVIEPELVFRGLKTVLDRPPMAFVRRDNQDENPATIRMRMRRCWGDEGRA